MKTPPLTKLQKHIVEREQRDNQGCCLFLTMGGGKTRVAIELIKKFNAQRILIISKSKIVHDTWGNELEKWGAGYYNYVCLANQPSKKQIQILDKGVPEMTIVATNFETFGKSIKIKNRPKRVDLANSPILQAYERPLWDIIIIDESTCIKDPTSNIALSMLNLTYNSPNAYVMCLTGTPNPEESLDFYTQITVVDRGKRFGESFNAWRDTYFYRPAHGFDYIPFPFGPDGKTIGEVIAELCKDMCYVLTKEENAKSLPPRYNEDVYFDLGLKSKSYFKQMKQNVIELGDKTITAQNAAIVVSKLLQISSGVIYGNEDENGKASYFFGLEKLNRTIDLIKQIDKKVIVCYNFTASKQNLELWLGLHNIEYCHADEISEKEFEESKTIKVMLLQPKSGAYGSNYQADCCNMIWYEITPSGEKFEQTEGRIHRKGQTKACTFYYLIGRGTYDKTARDQVRNKDATAVTVLKAIQAEQAMEASVEATGWLPGGSTYDECTRVETIETYEEPSPFEEEDDMLEDYYNMEDMF